MWNAMTSMFHRPVPVTVITGFLGSGKSTLLNYILTDLNHGMKFAVIENELGAVSIDDQLLPKSQGNTNNHNAGLVHEQLNDDEEIMVEVTNGCICCSIRKDLVRALLSLYPKIMERKLDGILLETTGLADPGPIVQTFFQNSEISSKFRLDGVVTVVDAKHILERLNEEKPMNVVNEAVEQVAFADKILLNKVDLVQTKNNINNNNNCEEYLQRIEEEIYDLNPTVSIVRTTHGQVPNLKETLLHIGGFELKRAMELDSEFLTKERKHRKDRAVSSVCCVVPGEVQLNLVQDWIRILLQPPPMMDTDDTHDHASHDHHHHAPHSHVNHQHQHHHQQAIPATMESLDEKNRNTPNIDDTTTTTLYRYKGILAVKGMKQKFIFQGVGMVFQGHFSEELVWDDYENDIESRQSQFVFIGKHLNKKELQSDFEACLVTEKLRFGIGTIVDANVGVWKRGTVIGHWDQGNPYRIRLEENGQQMWAPLDMDPVIRLAC